MSNESKALAITNGGGVIVQWGMTRQQLDLIKRTFADGTTDDEFALFMTTAERLGLDPFAKQIYAVKRPTYDKAAGRYIEKMAIQVGIDGFRAAADRTGENDGQDGPYWCGDDGQWVDAWLKKEPPAAARVVVYRKGCSRAFTGVATYASYAQTNRDGKPNRQWDQMPDVMLAKCAEALALRKAFPAKLSGVYAPEEMGQADNGRREQERHAEVADAEIVETQGDARAADDEFRRKVLTAMVEPAAKPKTLADEADELCALVETITKATDDTSVDSVRDTLERLKAEVAARGARMPKGKERDRASASYNAADKFMRGVLKKIEQGAA